MALPSSESRNAPEPPRPPPKALRPPGPPRPPDVCTKKPPPPPPPPHSAAPPRPAGHITDPRGIAAVNRQQIRSRTLDREIPLYLNVIAWRSLVQLDNPSV